jgi:hypothetical protein
MSNVSAAVAVYSTHTDADVAIKSLQKTGFDIKQLSIGGPGNGVGARALLASRTHAPCQPPRCPTFSTPPSKPWRHFSPGTTSSC